MVFSHFDVIGLVGTLLLSLCSVPQLFTTFRKKTVEGLSPSMLIACSLGCVLTLIFVLQQGVSLILVMNYLFNSLSYLALSIAYFVYRKRPDGNR